MFFLRSSPALDAGEAIAGRCVSLTRGDLGIAGASGAGGFAAIPMDLRGLEKCCTVLRSFAGWLAGCTFKD